MWFSHYENATERGEQGAQEKHAQSSGHQRDKQESEQDERESLEGEGRSWMGN
jgi:hypothetical protein